MNETRIAELEKENHELRTYCEQLTEERAGISAMIARMIALEEALRSYRAFFHDLCKWFHGDGMTEMDGAVFQGLGLRHGLLAIEPYDPERHGPNDVDAEPGADWFVPTDLADALLPRETGP